MPSQLIDKTWAYTEQVLAVVGNFTAAVSLIALVYAIICATRGSWPLFIRLAQGLSKTKVAIFASGDQADSLRDLLIDSALFRHKNICLVRSESESGRAEMATLFLIDWSSWGHAIESVLAKKSDMTGLVLYAPPSAGRVPNDVMEEISLSRNVTVTNFRGRLLNDLLLSILTTRIQ